VGIFKQGWFLTPRDRVPLIGVVNGRYGEDSSRVSLTGMALVDRERIQEWVPLVGLVTEIYKGDDSVGIPLVGLVTEIYKGDDSVGIPLVGLVTEIYRETILLGVPLVDIGY
jgi:hypothetical protein